MIFRLKVMNKLVNLPVNLLQISNFRKYLFSSIPLENTLINYATPWVDYNFTKL